MEESNNSFYRIIKNPFRFRLFMLLRLPAAYWSGLRLKYISGESCTVSVPYKKFTQNPFRSTYFACLSMAAEMTTGALAMACIYGRKPAVSMLIISVESKYYKKATGTTFFICNDGKLIADTITEALRTNEPQAVKAYSIGVNKAGETVAEFWFTWSFKAKKSEA